MTAINIDMLLELRQHLNIVHHVPGRLRLRAGSALYGYASALNGNGLLTLLESLEGIHDIRVNPAVASLIIQYDPTHFPPELWETLLMGNDQQAAQIFGELVTSYEHYLTGVQQ